jgi:fructose/tagatose bisphosphate aldolase
MLYLLQIQVKYTNIHKYTKTIILHSGSIYCKLGQDLRRRKNSIQFRVKSKINIAKELQLPALFSTKQSYSEETKVLSLTWVLLLK